MINTYALHMQSMTNRFEFENNLKETTTNTIETIQSKRSIRKQICSTCKYIQLFITMYLYRNKTLIFTLNKYL